MCFFLANFELSGRRLLVGDDFLDGLVHFPRFHDAEFFQGKAEGWIEEKIAEREAARKRKDFAAADRIRQELLERGIVLEDKGGKTGWRRA